VEINQTLVQPKEKPTRQRVILVVILFVTLMFSFVDRINISVLMADNNFLTELGLKGDPVKMGLLMTVFLFAYAVSNIFLSPLGDFMGPRKAITVCLPAWGAAMLCGAFAPTFAWILAARLLLGLGEGLHWPVQMKFVKNWFPPLERGKANSIWQVGLFAAPALAMPFLTWLLVVVNWRMSFVVLAATSLIPLVLVWFFTTDHPRDHKGVNKAELDWIENGLKAEKEEEAAMGTTTFMESLKVFVFNYRYWLLVAYFFFNSSVWWGIMTWLPSYLRVARGFSWTQMGALASLPYIIGAVCLIIFGYLTDKAGRRAPFCLFQMLGMAACVYFGAHAADNLTAAYLIAGAVAFVAAGLPANWSLGQQIVPAKALGAGAGIMNGVGSIGGALSPVAIGYFISVSGGSYVAGLMCLVGAAVLGALCMLVLVIQKY
jgi:sugar phosphate permease